MWALNADSLYTEYHDRDWGTPVHDDNTLFEFLVLEGAQAGLSWATVLKKGKTTAPPLTALIPQR
nr:DNA-3-methyladenine glycosylase I [Brucepastera parasyntrophica]